MSSIKNIKYERYHCRQNHQTNPKYSRFQHYFLKTPSLKEKSMTEWPPSLRSTESSVSSVRVLQP